MGDFDPLGQLLFVFVEISAFRLEATVIPSCQIPKSYPLDCPNIEDLIKDLLKNTGTLILTAFFAV